MCQNMIISTQIAEGKSSSRTIVIFFFVLSHKTSHTARPLNIRANNKKQYLTKTQVYIDKYMHNIVAYINQKISFILFMSCNQIILNNELQLINR